MKKSDLEVGQELILSYGGKTYDMRVMSIHQDTFLCSIKNPEVFWFSTPNGYYKVAYGTLDNCVLKSPRPSTQVRVERRIKKLWNESNWVKKNPHLAY